MVVGMCFSRCFLGDKLCDWHTKMWEWETGRSSSNLLSVSTELLTAPPVCLFPSTGPSAHLISSHLISPLLLLLSFLSLDIVFKISLNLSGCHFRPPAGSLHHPIREPRQDPGAAPADPVPLGRLLLLRSQNRLNYSGGEAAEMKQDKSLKKEKGV